MPRKQLPRKHAPRRRVSAFEKAWDELRSPRTPPPTVSGRWLLMAVGMAIVAAAACAWGVLCLLFWQGSWQLLYHPAAAVARTPASVGLAFDAVGFAATEAGQPRLKGWWIPADAQAQFGQYTVLYLHGQDGNLGDAVEAVAALHDAGVNVLALDYRGYGQSQFARPSETHWREDAEWALAYLTGTRHIAAGSIILDGEKLGANLALETGAQHPELGGVVLREPLEDAAHAIFSDARARLVPARLLVRDRFDLDAPAASLRIPLLWFCASSPRGQAARPEKPEAYERVTSRKTLIWLTPSPNAKRDFVNSLSGWLGDLSARRN